MFGEYGLITKYLIILFVLFSLNYCEIKEKSSLRQVLSNRGVNYRLLNGKHKYFNTKNSKLKQKLHKMKHYFEQQEFKNNIQLLKDQSKKYLLEVQNSYIENFRTKQKMHKKSTHSKYENMAHNIRPRSEEDIEDVDEETTTLGGRDLLEHIVEDLDEIRESNLGPQAKQKLCQLNGTWMSELLGLTFNISYVSNQTQKSPVKFTAGPVHLNVSECERGSDINEFPHINKSWTIRGEIPFTPNTMLILTAEYEPEYHVAVFLGQCRFSSKKELVIGQWMSHQYAHESIKAQQTQRIYGDVFRRLPKT